jgi:hypothetical protein
MPALNATNLSGSTKAITGLEFIGNTMSYGTGSYNLTNFEVPQIQLKQADIRGNFNTKPATLPCLVGYAFDYCVIDLTTDVYPIAVNATYIRYGSLTVYSSAYVTGSFVNENLQYYYTRIENKGAATVANGETITHGIDGTPNIVTVTAVSYLYDGVPFTLGVTSRGATTFAVLVYWVNGTAISDDTISILWYAKYFAG